MSENPTEAPEPAAEESPQHDEFPADHPLVKTLAAQKAAIKELKAKASRLDEIEESQKTEAEKFADRMAKADAEVAAVPSRVTEQLRGHLITLHKIDPDDAELFLTATDPETLLKQVDRLVGQMDKRTNHVPREGRSPKPSENSEAAFVRELFG